MAIDTSKFFFNKAAHVEIATELNIAASSKGVQVSRWVNNSKGRQIITYKVHRGERADRAIDQTAVLFEIFEDAGRGRQVRNETAMLNECAAFVASIEPEIIEPVYEITSDLIGDSEPATLEEIQDMVAGWDEDYPGWLLKIETSGDTVRLYAYRDGDEGDRTPSTYTPWIMVTSDYGYITLAEAASND